MLEHDLFPDEAMDETRVKEYWKHLESTKLAWACQHVDRYGYGFVPLFLWGDDAQFSEDRKEKIATMAIGAVLDDRRSSIGTIWPLCVFQVDA